MPSEKKRWIEVLVAAAVAIAVGVCPEMTPSSRLRADEKDATNGTSQSDAFASPSAEYQNHVLPILEQYCFACHADGSREGNVTFDEHPSTEAILGDTQLWWTVLKNVRADVMPPDGEDQPSESEKQVLFDWVTRRVFTLAIGADDPGPNRLRRLNRLEYRNTIRDLMGIDFDTSVEFPPDDSGDGFDNNADALSISPLLAEKYVDAAREIVDRAVPKTSRVVPAQRLEAEEFEIEGDSGTRHLSFDRHLTAQAKFSVEYDEMYRLVFPLEIDGSFDFSADRARVRLLLDDHVLLEDEYGWRSDFEETLSFEHRLRKGEHSLRVELKPAQPTESELDHEGTFVRLRLPSPRVEGPLDPKYWHPPEGYERFFPATDPPANSAEQFQYATDVLRRFCRRAYRRPVDEEHLRQLLELGGIQRSATNVGTSDTPDSRTLQQRIGVAMQAVLASPRFLFRVDRPVADSEDAFPEVDDYSLASRLSYFLWSTMPDQELFQLAENGTLRSKLPDQVRRMLGDERSRQLIENFVGQWLQTRDVESVSIDPLAALGVRAEYDQLRDYLETTSTGRGAPPSDASPEHLVAYKRYQELRDVRQRLDADVRRDMAEETERLFSYVIREDRSLIELLEADYAFLNQRLARHYGVPGVEGDEIRKVALPPDSPWGGVLTQGTFLLVTSNPTRTSPVKRGLFVLDNILGTPAPPPPAEVPELEASAAASEIKNPTLRQLLEIHRRDALCRSCHARFDPIGLAFENFTAMGTWRDDENGQPIEPAGQLISGESFKDVRELKQILAGPRHHDFYRCLCERMLSYAIGRSLDFGDELVLEEITRELERNHGRAQTLIDGVVDSAALRRMRRPDDRP